MKLTCGLPRGEILSNAMKFTPENGAIRVTVEEEGEEIVLRVSDSGPGVPEPQRAEVFDRFRQLDGTATRAFGGTGLGLTISRDFAELHGGSIACEDAPEGGAMFVVRLPLRPAGGEPLQAEESADESLDLAVQQAGEALRRVPERVAQPSPGRPRVLLVEDNPDMSHFVADVLSENYDVEISPDGADALDRARDRTPDLILTDLMMPNMSGDEFVLALRKEPGWRAFRSLSYRRGPIRRAG